MFRERSVEGSLIGRGRLVCATSPASQHNSPTPPHPTPSIPSLGMSTESTSTVKARYAKLIWAQDMQRQALRESMATLVNMLDAATEGVPLSREQIFDVVMQSQEVADMGRELEIRSEDYPGLLSQWGAERSQASAPAAASVKPEVPTLEPGMAAAAAPQEAPIKTPPTKKRRSTR